MYRDYYRQEVVSALKERFQYENIMQVPKIDKIVVSMGIGVATGSGSSSSLDNAMKDLSAITGQKPGVRRARKSVSAFRVREGMAVGCVVTLRGERMYEMLMRLVKIVLPQIRDFRGVNPNAFDGRGNFSLGLDEQAIFPEISYDQIGQVQGMNIAVVTTAKTDEEGRELLRLMGMPFRDAA